MNIVFWVLQFLLAVHTGIGAVWKFSNSAQSVPSLHAIPQPAWLALSVIEIACSVCLVLPAWVKSLAPLAAIAALCIAAEMLLFCALHLASGDTNHGQMVYWLVVATICAIIAYGRFVWSPVRAV